MRYLRFFVDNAYTDTARDKGASGSAGLVYSTFFANSLRISIVWYDSIGLVFVVSSG